MMEAPRRELFSGELNNSPRMTVADIWYLVFKMLGSIITSFICQL